MFTTRNSLFCVAFLVSMISNAELESCPDVEKLKIVPGAGWDVLTDDETRQLLRVTYEKCQLTHDGKFMIPDNTVEVPLDVQEERVEAEIFEHWSNYTALSSAGLKVATDAWPEQFLPLFFTFSEEYQQMKSFQAKNETFTCRSQVRRVIYRINTTPNATIGAAAKKRFGQVIRVLGKNNTEEARHLIEMIVNDYGTHYTKNIDVGTVIAMEDYLKNGFLEKHVDDKNKILSASKLSLVEYIKITGISMEDQQQHYLDSSLFNEYKAAILKKKVRFSGELNWKSGANSECVVAIDRSGNVLSSLVTSSNFPNTSPAVLIKMRRMFSDVIRNYYTRNIHRGCTQPISSNFDFAANLDDGSCKSAPVPDYYLFGGVYAAYKISPYHEGYSSDRGRENPLTKAYSCPTNFQSQVFYSWQEMSNSYSEVFTFVSCLSLANDLVGPSYLFGGFYSDQVDNIHTKNKSCPQFYSAPYLPMVNWKLCVSSTDNDLAKQYALHFGGFATADTDYQCPVGYERHFAAPVGITYKRLVHGKYNYGKLYYCLQEQSVKNMDVVPSLVRFSFE